MKQVYVVTGASSGIGFALCCLLAQHNKEVIAIARRKKELDILKNKYPALISIIPADLGNEEERNEVVNKLSSHNILGLINNVSGISS